MIRAAVLFIALLGAIAAPPAGAQTSAAFLRGEIAEKLENKYADIIPPGASVTVLNTVSPEGSITGKFLEVSDVSLDLAVGKYGSVVATTNGRFIVLGRVSVEVDLPMPNRRIDTGERITARDIASAPMPLNAVEPDMLRSMGDIVGQEARRTLSPGRPVQQRDLAAPTVIEKNQIVTLRFVKGPLEITARGRALDEGGVGDVIRVMNIDSSKIVTGEISRDGAVMLIF